MAKKKPKPRRYSDDERSNAIAAAAANGGNVNLTAKQIGIPAKTIANWVKGERHPESAQLGEQKKGPLADQFEALAHKLLGVASEKADRLNAKDATTAAAIAVDKMQLLRSKPTSITRSEGESEDLSELSDEQLDRRIADARSRVAAPSAGPCGGGGGPAGAGAGAEAVPPGP